MPSSGKVALSVPAFQNGENGITPEFGSFLEKIIEVHLQDENPRRINDTERETWATLISGLAQTFLVPLPGPSVKSLPWKILSEKVSMIKLCLTIVRRVVSQYLGVLKGNDIRAISLVSDCLSFLLSVDAWIGVSIPEGLKTPPQELRQTVLEVIHSILANIEGGSEFTSLGNFKLLAEKLMCKARGEVLVLHCRIDCSVFLEMTTMTTSLLPVTVELYDLSIFGDVPEVCYLTHVNYCAPQAHS